MSKTQFQRMLAQEKALRKKAKKGLKVKESDLKRLRGRLGKMALRNDEDEDNYNA